MKKLWRKTITISVLTLSLILATSACKKCEVEMEVVTSGSSCEDKEENIESETGAETVADQGRDTREEVHTDLDMELSESSNTSEEVEEEKDTDVQKNAKLASPANSGALQVIDTKLCDKFGNPVQLRGISTHGLAWFPDYVNDSLFQQFRNEWNVNVMRLAMYTDEYAGYCSGGDKEELKKLVKSGVICATDNDMYVIIDWHVLNDKNPNVHIEDAKSFFDEMSKEYAKSENVLYEICNEPNGETTWGDIKSYAKEIIPIIRNNDSDAIIIVGTPNWSQYVDQAASDPIDEYDNIMYALHFYAATHKEWLRDNMTNAIDQGLPIFVTEYGICDASGSGSIDESEANCWVDLMDRLGVSYVAWNLSNKNETSSIIRASCSKTSNLETSDLSVSGKWLINMLTSKKENSEAKEENTEASGDSTDT